MSIIVLERAQLRYSSYYNITCVLGRIYVTRYCMILYDAISLATSLTRNYIHVTTYIVTYM